MLRLTLELMLKLVLELTLELMMAFFAFLCFLRKPFGYLKKHLLF